MKLNNSDEIVIEKTTNITAEKMELLLLADPLEKIVREYLKKGQCFDFKKNNVIVGIMVLLPTTLKLLKL